eukprot:Clim_evm93s172 gene=Clim_evmTU93s172
MFEEAQLLEERLGRAMNMAGTRVRRHEIMKTNSIFLCGGRCVTAPDNTAMIVAEIIIHVPIFMYFYYVAPDFHAWGYDILWFLIFWLYILSQTTLFATALMDPGILPRAGKYEAAHNEQGTYTLNEETGRWEYKAPEREKQVRVNGLNVKLKWCYTCKIFRPPRASHCGVCNNCVLRFDHHCPWTANCIGERNYKWFYGFMVSTVAMCAIACFEMFFYILKKNKVEGAQRSIGQAFLHSPYALAIFVICLVVFIPLFALLGFHTGLVAANQTTTEAMKNTFRTKNPYRSNMSYYGNILHELLKPTPPSLIDATSYVEVPNDEDIESRVHERAPEYENGPDFTQGCVPRPVESMEMVNEPGHYNPV